MIGNLIRLVGWILLFIVALALFGVLFPLILAIGLIMLVIGAFRRTLFLSWVSRFKDGAQRGAANIREKFTESTKPHKAGERRRVVVDADVKEL